MDEGLKGIKRIEIKKLWGKYDLVWDLQPDVNILAGINGSGKSTVLNFVYKIAAEILVSEKTINCVESCTVVFTNGRIRGYINMHDINNKNIESKIEEFTISVC